MKICNQRMIFFLLICTCNCNCVYDFRPRGYTSHKQQQALWLSPTETLTLALLYILTPLDMIFFSGVHSLNTHQYWVKNQVLPTQNKIITWQIQFSYFQVHNLFTILQHDMNTKRERNTLELSPFKCLPILPPLQPIKRNAGRRQRDAGGTQVTFDSLW